MIRFGWRFRLAPLPGELLSSCLARNAFAHGSTPYRFMNLFWEGEAIWNRDFDRDPARLLRRDRRKGAADWFDDLAEHLGTPRRAIEGATLHDFRRLFRDGRASDSNAGDVALILSAGVYHRTRTRHALQFCPGCLAHGVPHFRKAWRLGFVVACPEHGCLLLDACDRCGAAVVPHRSMTTGVADCHECGASIFRVPDDEGAVGGGVIRLQRSLLGALDDEGIREPSVGPWPARDLPGIVRALLGVSASWRVHAGLRDALCLGRWPFEGGARMRFEQSRLAVRMPWLETVAAWMADWPASFRVGAAATGLTQRSFARVGGVTAIEEEIRRLPPGMRRDRSWKPVLEEPVLRRLRRMDPPAYATLRAARMMAAIRAGVRR